MANISMSEDEVQLMCDVLDDYIEDSREALSRETLLRHRSPEALLNSTWTLVDMLADLEGLRKKIGRDCKPEDASSV